MVAEQGQRAVPLDEVETLDGIGTVSDHVTEADHPVDVVPSDVLEHGLEGMDVRMDVADERGTHEGARGGDGSGEIASPEGQMLLESLGTPHRRY